MAKSGLKYIGFGPYTAFLRRLKKISVAFAVLFLLRWLGRGGVIDSAVWSLGLSEFMAERACGASGEEGQKEGSMEDKGVRCFDLLFGVWGRDVFGTWSEFARYGDGLKNVEKQLGLRLTWIGVNWIRLWELKVCSLSRGSKWAKSSTRSACV